MEETHSLPRAQVSERSEIFISHATPGDNVFATWLGSRLAMAGYKVWCDQEKLIGGEDFWQDIETALRSRTIKFVLVVSAKAFDENRRLRDGIAKEIALATVLKKQLNDDYFVIPMRIDDTSYSDFSIDFLRLNGIDCADNWAAGFANLLEALERDEVPRTDGLVEPSLSAWRAVHTQQARHLSEGEELLQSNWLKIESFPEQVHFYEILRPVKSSEPRAIASSCPLPCFDHGRLLGCFAEQDEFQAVLGEGNPVKLRGSIDTLKFLEGETGDLIAIEPRDARAKVTSAIRQAWNSALEAKGLSSYEMANQKLAWWFPENLPEDGQLHYIDFNGKPRRRAVSGVKGKKVASDGTETPRYYWHLGFTGKVFLGDMPALVLQPRIIISEDNKTPIENKTRLNSIRRSLTSMWFNEKWRGLIMGFSAWLANGNENIELPVASNAAVKLSGRPLTLRSSIRIQADPVSHEVSEADEEQNERLEEHMRLSDPAFILREDEEGDALDD